MSSIYVGYADSWKYFEADYIANVLAYENMYYRIQAFSRNLIRQIPSNGQLRFFPASYRLNALGLAHILRHHYLPGKNPGKSKFTITIPEIVHYTRQGIHYTEVRTRDPFMFKRVFPVKRIIGIDLNGKPSSMLEVVTDCYGDIRSAYPAVCNAPGSQHH